MHESDKEAERDRKKGRERDKSVYVSIWFRKVDENCNFVGKSMHENDENDVLLSGVCTVHTEH